MPSQKKDIRIVAASAEATGGQTIYRDTTVPLAVQPQTIIDTAEISTPYSKRRHSAPKSIIPFENSAISESLLPRSSELLTRVQAETVYISFNQ